MAPNLLWRCPPLKGSYIPNSKKIPLTIPNIQGIKKFLFFFFSHPRQKSLQLANTYSNPAATCNNHWGPKANLSITFGAHLIRMNALMCKTKSNFCHTYRVNQLEEQIENRYVARFNIREVPFGG